MGAVIAGVAFFVLAVGIYFGVAPEEKDMTKGMNMDNLTKKSKKAEPAPTPAPAAAPAPAPAAAPSADKPADPAK